MNSSETWILIGVGRKGRGPVLCSALCFVQVGRGLISGEKGREDQDHRKLKIVPGGGGLLLSPVSKELLVCLPLSVSPLYTCQKDGWRHSVFKLLGKLWEEADTFLSAAELYDLPVFQEFSLFKIKHPVMKMLHS